MIPFADGFEDIEAFTVVDVLRRAGVEVDTVGIVGTQITSSHGVRVWVDKKVTDVNSDEYDAIILPGGNPGYINLGRSSKLVEIIRQMSENKKIIAAICGAPTILAKVGILDDKKATVCPGLEKELPYPRDERVVVDNNIITSQGPGTAIEFALKIVDKLVGAQMASRLKKDLIVQAFNLSDLEMEPNGITQQLLEEIARKQVINKEELVSFLQKKVDNPLEVVAVITKDLSSRGLITNVSPIGESYFAITQKGMREVGK